MATAGADVSIGGVAPRSAVTQRLQGDRPHPQGEQKSPNCPLWVESAHAAPGTALFDRPDERGRGFVGGSDSRGGRHQYLVSRH